MNTITDEKSSEGAENSPEKWLNVIAALQAENRTLKAQLSVVKGLAATVGTSARLWDEDGEPCWCSAHGGTQHGDECWQLRRLLRGLAWELEPAQEAP